jgi:hypothetical protein
LDSEVAVEVDVIAAHDGRRLVLCGVGVMVGGLDFENLDYLGTNEAIESVDHTN